MIANIFIYRYSKQVYFSKDYRHRVWPFKRISVLEHFEDVKNLETLLRVFSKSATSESKDSDHMDRVIGLLIAFLKLHRPNDTVCKQVIELVSVFKRAIQIKAKLFQELKRLLLGIRLWKTVPRIAMHRMQEQFACLKKCTSCVDLEMVAKRLTSTQVFK